ncbi:MAG: hypothetical protein Q9184_002814 [Pyrenodesmia sp. 2 TL-2023]
MAPDAKTLGASLVINLDAPSQGRQSYVPGDVLEGEIVLYNPYHAAGLEASVNFSGTSKVRFKEKGRLFSPVHTHQDEFLSLSCTDLARTTRQDAVLWSFRIPIPSLTSKSSARFAADESFANFPSCSLPPSFDAQVQVDGRTQLERHNVNPYGKVVYTLRATLTKPFFMHSYVGPTICQMQLPLSSLRSLETGASALQAISLHYHDILLDNLGDRALDMLEHVHCGLARDIFVAGNCLNTFLTPNITIKASIPISYMAEQPLEIALFFSGATVKYARENLSPLVLHALNVEIVSEIQTRTLDALRREPQAKGGNRCAFYSLDAARVSTSQRFYRLIYEKYSGYQWGRDFHSKIPFEPPDRGFHWDVGALVPDSTTTSVDIPTFKTSNLSVSYTVHVRAEFSLCDEKIPFDITRPLVVAPRSIKEDVLPSKNPIATSHAEGGKGIEGDAPPPYSEDHRTTQSAALPGKRNQLPSYQTALEEKR